MVLVNVGTILQIVDDSDVRYIPKSMSLSITVRSPVNLNLVPKHIIMTSRLESPCLIVASSMLTHISHVGVYLHVHSTFWESPY